MHNSLTNIPIHEIDWDNVKLLWVKWGTNESTLFNDKVIWCTCKFLNFITSFYLSYFDQSFKTMRILYTCVCVFKPITHSYVLTLSMELDKRMSTIWYVKFCCWFSLSQRWNSESLKFVVFLFVFVYFVFNRNFYNKTRAKMKSNFNTSTKNLKIQACAKT